MPFGEEIGTGIGGRTIAMGFAVNDGQRQKFTQKERDSETGLDFFLARYYSAGHGRFISPDEPLADQTPDEPQSWNLYAYVRNNPLRAIDPDGKQSLLEKYRNWRNGYGFKTDKEVRSEECTRRSLLDYVASANETPDRLIITNANTGVETVVIISQMTRREIWYYSNLILNGQIDRRDGPQMEPVIGGGLRGPSGKESGEKYIENNWDKGTLGTIKKSVRHHLRKH